MSVTHLHEMPYGARALNGGVRFRLYAPSARCVGVVYDTGTGPRRIAAARTADGFFEATASDADTATRYRFDVDGRLVPDPASRRQPQGVHGPSQVTDPRAFAWDDDAWNGLPWNDHVFYELHVGAFTPEGTFAGVAGKLDELARLGVTAIELMPVADVPGTRNWGYDGVLPFAPSHNYGSPNDLKALVVAAHARGLAVYLDVVYNHFGPEGNYLHGYAPEFYTDRFATPWGAALDFLPDDRAAVRAFFIENALYWLDEFRFDGLRLDAVHAIGDGPERRFLRELAAAVRARIPRPVHLILENDGNESSLMAAGYRAQWNDDLHHALHVALTGERDGYYADYANDPAAALGRTLASGFAYQGDPSPFRGGATRGEPSTGLELGAFVNFLQNHDQVGNRPFGERIASTTSDAALRAGVAVLLLAPSPPLLFMGEEWAASTPFLFFCDFEPDLAAKVTAGRRGEFASFAAFADPKNRERIPDPAAPETFAASTLRWDERERAPHAAWLAYYTQLLAVRRAWIAPRVARVRGTDAHAERIGAHGLAVRWRLDDGTHLALDANLSDAPSPGFEANAAGRILFATHDVFDGGSAPPWSVRWSLA